MTTTRKLAAILAGDVASYSALMGADEEGTLARLNAHRREFLDPKIAEHRGRVVKRTGDGILIEFASVVDAVRCAIETQRGMAERNSGVLKEQRIELRIGINVGDIIIEDDDIFGDGVNIAARLESIAEPGGISISRAAHEQIKGKLGATFEDSGEQQLKNIAQPVRVYRLRPSGAPSAHPISLALPDKPSIAVLAFQNMSGDVEQEYFADGIAEDIITALSRNHLLFVIARNSSFTYKGRAVDVKQVGRELGVRYVLEGSVRKAGNRIRITGQLIEATTGRHLWAERYDRDLSDIFALQDEITASVAMAIGPAVAQAERERVARKPAENLDAWEAYHRGLWHFLKQTPEENQLAKPFFQRAIDLDPNFAPGYHGLALAHCWDSNPYGLRPAAECIPLARNLARQAVALDDADAVAHYSLGTALLLGGDLEGGCAELERAVSLDPNHAWAMAALGVMHGWRSRPREVLALIERAMRGSPHDPMTWIWLNWMAWTHYFARDYSAALATADRLIRARPEHGYIYRVRAAALGQLGRVDEAKAALQRAMEFRTFDMFVRRRAAHWSAENFEHQLEGLRKAGLPE